MSLLDTYTVDELISLKRRNIAARHRFISTYLRYYYNRLIACFDRVGPRYSVGGGVINMVNLAFERLQRLARRLAKWLESSMFARCHDCGIIVVFRSRQTNRT